MISIDSKLVPLENEKSRPEPYQDGDPALERTCVDDKNSIDNNNAAKIEAGSDASNWQGILKFLASELSSTAKVERWFELLEPMSISRPESGFVSCQDPEQEDDDDERAILEGTRSLLMKLSARKRRKLMGLKLGKVTTF